MVCVRKGLNHSVVRDGNCRMSPLVGPLYDILGLGHAVHIAHLCMAVKLHTLSCAVVIPGGGEISDFLDPHKGTYCQLVVKPVDHGDALKLHKASRL